jgi:hypothetical protein
VSKLIITHDSGGEPTGFRYEPDDEYVPGEGEINPNEDIDHREIHRYRVTDTGELVGKQNPEPDPDDDLQSWAENLHEKTPLLREEITEQTQTKILQARANGNIQKQIDTVFEVVTGVHPDDVDLSGKSNDSGN